MIILFLNCTGLNGYCKRGVLLLVIPAAINPWLNSYSIEYHVARREESHIPTAYSYLR